MGFGIRYKVEILKTAQKDISKIKKSGRISDKKNLELFLEELKIHPRTGSGKPEQMKYRKGEIWSRRINKKDRLVYEIFENKILVEVQTAVDHYNDK